MSDLIQLLLDRSVERRMAMAMEVDPDGGGAIQLLLPFRIDQVGPFSFFDNERRLLLPFLHLGEGVPKVPVIPLNQLSGRWFMCHIPVGEVVKKLIALASIRGGDFFDNLGGAHYNESILLGNELGFAKPYTQFLDYRPYRSRQINPR